MIRVAINGFGRIGKTFLRTILADPQAKKEIKIVAINLGPTKDKDIAHYFKYDSVMGTYPGTIDDANIETILTEPDPAKLPWNSLNIDWVVECTGHFTSRDGAQKHLDAGAKNVLISAPAKGEDVTIIPGVNRDKYDSSKHKIVSLGSCTTNAFVPTVHVLHKHFGIASGYMSTVHAVTNTQALLDIHDSDPRRSRSGMLNIVPASTGAMDVIGKIFPDLAPVISGHAFRVPVPTVSLLDFAITATKIATVDDIHEAFITESKGQLKNILACTKEPLVSTDFRGDPHSVTIDMTLTKAMGNSLKVFGWYDNEWGYSSRLKDFLLSL